MKVGITIDYGPFGFMDRYDPEFICNGSDHKGRYDYQSQPSICKWNLVKFAEQIDHVIPHEKSREIITANYNPTFLNEMMAGARNKLGLFGKDDADTQLFESFLNTMNETAADFTNTFRALSSFKTDKDGKATNESKAALVKHIVENCCHSVEEWKNSAMKTSGGGEIDMIRNGIYRFVFLCQKRFT